MQLTKHKQNWEELATLDPLWAILSNPEKRFNKWDTEVFLQTGDQQAQELVAMARTLHRPRQWNRALDFGCGVGRITRALGHYFKECHGVDISSEMVHKARELAPQCCFHEHSEPNLNLFSDSSFDLVYSVIVLQHQPDRETVFAYINEFMRVLEPGGLLAFQLPSYIPLHNRVQGARRLYALLKNVGFRPDFLYRRLKLVPIRMQAISERNVVNFLGTLGGKILHICADSQAGNAVHSKTYFVSR
jgi:ubiquinone/menaquinone biosynthesis C-methylase UbiE